MNASVYEQLADTIALRNEPFGGVCPVVKCTELWALLEHLFTPEEAEIGAKMPLNPISAEALAQDMGRDPKDVEKLLETMANKGTVVTASSFGVRTAAESGGSRQYSLLPLMPGALEHQMVRDVVDEHSKEFARVLQGYYTALSRLKEAGTPAATPTFPLSRVAVAEDTIPDGAEILPYDKVSKYVADSDYVILSTCGCRNVGKLLGHPCDKPLDVCLGFGKGNVPDSVASGKSRLISKEEALKTLDRAEKAGLVHVITNTSNSIAYCCNCCMDHCMTLRALKSPVMFAGPAPSSFIMVVDEDECMGCGDCIDRCQFEALSMKDDIVARDADRCFGCGLCVSVCPTSALRMEPREQRPTPCKNYGELIQMMAASWRSDPTLPGGDTEYFLVSD
jgi:NAD-dependent dihydropyrimidine dehydrogenase PreA subunit